VGGDWWQERLRATVKDCQKKMPVSQQLIGGGRRQKRAADDNTATNKQWEQQRQSGLMMRAVLDDWQAKATQFLSFGCICLTNFLMSLLHLPKDAVVTVSSSLFLTVPELSEL
jgi:hypothetical protein